MAFTIDRKKGSHSLIRKFSKDADKKQNEKYIAGKNSESKHKTTDKIKAGTSFTKPLSRNGKHSQSPRRILRSPLRKLSPHKKRNQISIHGNSVIGMKHSRSPIKSMYKRSDEAVNATRKRSFKVVGRRSRSPFNVRRRSKSPFALPRQSRSPIGVGRQHSPALNRHRSKSPIDVFRKKSRSPFVNRRRSGSPITLRQRLRSPIVNRFRSRSPLRVTSRVSRLPVNNNGRQSRSPIRIAGRVARASYYVNRRRSRSPLSRSHRRPISPLNAEHKRGSSPRLSRSQTFFNRSDVRSPERGMRSKTPPNRFQSKRSRSPRNNSKSSSRTRSPVGKHFIDSFHQLEQSFEDEVSPTISQPSFPPDMSTASWSQQNNESYNYNYQQPVANVTYSQPPPAFPPYAFTQPVSSVPNSLVPQVPYFPNSAFPPPLNTFPPQLPNLGYPPPVPPPNPSQIINNQSTSPQFQHLIPGNSIPEKNSQNEHRNKKVFNELRSVVTKLFGISDTNKPSLDSKGPELNIPFASTSSDSSSAQSLNISENKGKMYLETIQKLREEFGTFRIPDEMFKNALRGIFPEDLLKKRALQLLNEKKEEQKDSNQTKMPDMKSKVEFKESFNLPPQGNIFPIVKQDMFAGGSLANPNRKATDSFNNRLESEFKQISDRPRQDPNHKTLAQRLASALIKVGMMDVPGPLLAEMLHKIGAFNRSLPMQDITESEIISLLDRCGYLRK